MKMQVSIALAAAAFIAGLGASVSGLSAAPKPKPTPTPVALQYDELSRAIMPGATAPPPGSFQDDYKLAMSAGAASGTQNTPAPPKHRGLGGLIGNVLGGAVPQEPNVNGMMAMMRAGHLVRYTFYYSKSWMREDDPVAQTATISKCQQHQFITLNLAKKTYRVSDTSPKGCDTMPAGPMGSQRPAAVENAPGTAILTLKATSAALGAKTIDGIATTGASTVNEISMTEATGSCRNADMKMTLVAYTSSIRKPRAYCPLVTPKYVPSSPTDVVARGGCKPTIHTSGGAMAMRSSDEMLDMYRLMTMSSGAQGSAYSSLLERGNVAWLYKPQADPLFAIPPDFTEEK